MHVKNFESREPLHVHYAGPSQTLTSNIHECMNIFIAREAPCASGRVSFPVVALALEWSGVILEGAPHAATEQSRLVHLSHNGVVEGREMIWLPSEGLEQSLQSRVAG